jgi:hypothetical protein
MKKSQALDFGRSGCLAGNNLRASRHTQASQLYEFVLGVSIGSPNPYGGLFLSPDQKGGEKKILLPLVDGRTVWQKSLYIQLTIYNQLGGKTNDTHKKQSKIN